MNALLVSDLHLTANPRDEYRWKIFKQIREIARVHAVRDVLFLGDLTDAKDYHSARLVNRVVNALLGLYGDKGAGIFGVWVLRGNHDGTDPTCPYFQFLGRYPAIKYIATPYMLPLNGKEVLFLPHSRDPMHDWEPVEMHRAEVIFMHATVQGSLSENGMALDGIPPGCLATARRAKIFSGDVHVPQKIGRVEYVGAPYPVHFGDNFQPRAILLKDWKDVESIPLSNIRRMMVTMGPDVDIETLGLFQGDQVKVRVQLLPAEFHLWNDVKRRVMQDCHALGIELCGMELLRPEAQPLPKVKQRPVLVRSPHAILKNYCDGNKVDADMQAAGNALIEETLNVRRN